MSSKTPTDTLYRQPQAMVVDFAFDRRVAEVFPDMIRRSVPGYADIIAQLGVIAERYAQDDSRCYDLGCSLGAATLSMRQRIQARNCRIIAVDNSPDMLDKCRSLLAQDTGTLPVELQCADLRAITIERASVVVLNFTLQFIEAQQRLALLRNIANGMLAGGVLILSEKIRFEDALEQGFQEQLHLDFKRANGYSELEISQKRAALEKVLVPDTLEQHRERLREAGFSQVHLWHQSFNFISLAAIK